MGVRRLGHDRAALDHRHGVDARAGAQREHGAARRRVARRRAARARRLLRPVLSVVRWWWWWRCSRREAAAAAVGRGGRGRGGRAPQARAADGDRHRRQRHHVVVPLRRWHLHAVGRQAGAHCADARDRAAVPVPLHLRRGRHGAAAQRRRLQRAAQHDDQDRRLAGRVPDAAVVRGDGRRLGLRGRRLRHPRHRHHQRQQLDRAGRGGRCRRHGRARCRHRRRCHDHGWQRQWQRCGNVAPLVHGAELHWHGGGARQLCAADVDWHQRVGRRGARHLPRAPRDADHADRGVHRVGVHARLLDAHQQLELVRPAERQLRGRHLLWLLGGAARRQRLRDLGQLH